MLTITAVLSVLASCATAPASEKTAEKGAATGSTDVAVETAPREQLVVDPANLIPHNGQRVFLSGMNLAWMDFARDLDRFNEGKFAQQVGEYLDCGRQLHTLVDSRERLAVSRVWRRR